MFSFFISQIKPDNVDVPHNIELLRILAHLFNREHDLILEKSWSLYSILFTKFLPKFTPDEAIDYIIPKLEMFKLLKTNFPDAYKKWFNFKNNYIKRDILCYTPDLYDDMIQYESQKINIFFQDRIKKGY